MGIHGIFKEIGQGQRISLAKLSSDHFAAHERPFCLAIDISIWLFQIQAGKGGSNPALRTFYYRLLRLLTLNIHPLFVFDGPNKPLFKRNKKVGGPGVRVASVPEFLAKQLLKHFGFPWHVAPGEAEAECALLQREGIVDAVLSEDVDTLMFGSGTTLRNWTAESTTKTPTHVNVYRAAETKERSGLDREGMILVALMSGGDYITEGIPGCGPKVGCDAARAGFGKELVDLAKRRDMAGLRSWRERLQHEIKTNESRFFSRKNNSLKIPEEFPNRELLGYYTDPCISTTEKLARLRADLKWDQEIDFTALRSFAADAFDWRCLGGAKKFIRNLAPAMLVRELRLLGNKDRLDTDAQAEREQNHVLAIHGKRTHSSTDAELEYRITFVPQSFVPIDLSLEDEDDDFVPAGGVEEQSEADDEWAQIPSSTAQEDEEPASPTKKRNFKPYHPDQPEKIWLMRNFLQVGCPLLVEDYEASLRDPKQLFKQRRPARAAAKGDNMHAKKPTKRKKKAADMPENALHAYTRVVKSHQQEVDNDLPSSQESRQPLKDVSDGANGRTKKAAVPESKKNGADEVVRNVPSFKMPSTQHLRLPSPGSSPQSTEQGKASAASADVFASDDDTTPKASKAAAAASHFAQFAKPKSKSKQADAQKTPQRRKRRSEDISSPALSQRSIASYFSPSPRKQPAGTTSDIINLVSSSPAKPTDPPQPSTPTPPRLRGGFIRDDDELPTLPDSVTKRRKPLKRAKTAPVTGDDDNDLTITIDTAIDPPSIPDPVEAMDLASTPHSPKRHSESSTHHQSGSEMPPPPRLQQRPQATSRSRPTSSSSSTSLRRSPRHSSTQSSLTISTKVTKKRIIPRESLPGSWKEIDEIDLSGDGSGWAQSGGKAKIVSTTMEKVKVKGWRKSGVEVLDLTGAD
ncbi:Flap endonuclease GEN-like 1 [Pseudocercospora fuligena]|uniref:Flap endonuclease GEN-like 1 n=1 Tax=Pseudocercospora fuligena TaxID=685502 RepID=A0A8H6RHT2_9PEZI|nr:Flap endonuclease GEN-like 1 [Pseudocercospora fuligena]